MTPSNPLNDYALILVSGEQVTRFLQGQLSCDVNLVESSSAQPFCYCNVKGRVVSLGWVIYWHNEYYLLVDQPDHLLVTMNKYAMLSRITLNKQDEIKIFGLMTKQNNALGKCYANTNQLLIHLFPHSQLAILITKNNSVDPTKLPDHLVESTWLTPEQWQQQIIINQIPKLTPQTQEKYTPQMLNAVELKAISFEKGCYLGQEIIARTQHLGKRKRAMYCLKSKMLGNISIACKIYHDDTSIGEVILCQKMGQSIVMLAVLNLLPQEMHELNLTIDSFPIERYAQAYPLES